MPVRKPEDWPAADDRLVSKLDQIPNASNRADWRGPEVPLPTELEASGTQTVLVCYRHPVHDYYNWSAAAPVADAIAFVREHFNRERGEGLDMFLATSDLSAVWVTNHDGDVHRIL